MILKRGKTGIKILFLAWILFNYLTVAAHSSEVVEQHLSINDLAIPKVPLSVKEKIFLSKNDTIQIGTDHGWVPFAIKKQDGSLDGFEIDMMHIFSKMTGGNFQIVTDKWSFIQERAKSKDIDGLADSTVNKEREPFFNFTKSYIQLYPVFVVRSDSNFKITNIQDLSGKRVAILKGNMFNLSLLREHPEIEIVEVDTEKEAIKYTVEGRSHATLIAANTFTNHYKEFSNIIKIGYIETSRSLNLVYSIRKDWPEAITIINKCLSAMPSDLYDSIFHKWFKLDPVSKVKGPQKLTTNILDNFYPYSFINDAGEPDGYVVDLLQALAREIDVEVEIRQENLENSLIKLLNGQINTMPMLVYSENRELLYDFSQAHTVTYDAIFTRNNDPKPVNLNGLLGKTILVIKNDKAHEYLRDLPGIEADQFIFVNSPLEALKKLSSGTGDAVVIPKVSGITLLEKHNITNIDKSPHIVNDYTRLLCFAVKEGDIELLAKIKDGLQLLKEKGIYKDIHDEWLSIYEPEAITLKKIIEYTLWIIIPFLILFGLLLLWSITLKKQVRKRTIKLEEEIAIRKVAESELSKERDNLQLAIKEINTLRGIIPICCYCKDIRKDDGAWEKLEDYVSHHSEAEFSHGICPDCVKKLEENDWSME